MAMVQSNTPPGKNDQVIGPKAQGNKKTASLPLINTSGRQDRDIIADYKKAIAAANDADPFLFSQGDTGTVIYVRIRRGSNGRAVSEQVNADIMMNIMKEVADTVAIEEGKAHATHISKALATMLLNEPECLFKPIEGMRYTPFFRKDGTYVTKPGYDEQSHYYYDPIEGQSFTTIPDTQEAARQAAHHLLDLVGEFPFVSEAAKANYLALGISLVTQGSFQGKAPVAVFDAISDKGSGKTLLTNIMHIIATGEEMETQSMPDTDADMRKLLTGVAITGCPVFVIDNVRGKINSPSLEAFITAPSWSDRILGGNKIAKMRVNTITILNGNNVQLGKDMNRRCYMIRLDAKMGRAYTRKGFKIKHIAAHVQAHRQEYLTDILTMVKAWHAAGQPLTKTTVYDGAFPGWAEMVANILAYAGMTNIFDSALEDMISADTEEEEWASWLGNIREQYNDQSFLAKDLASFCIETPNGAIAETVPSSLAMEVDRIHNVNTLAHKMSIYLRMRKGRRFGDQEYRLESIGVGRTGVTLWRIFAKEDEAPIPPPADETPPQEPMMLAAFQAPITSTVHYAPDALEAPASHRKTAADFPTIFPAAQVVTVPYTKPTEDAQKLLDIFPDDLILDAQENAFSRVQRSTERAVQRYVDAGQPRIMINIDASHTKELSGVQLFNCLAAMLKKPDGVVKVKTILHGIEAL